MIKLLHGSMNEEKVEQDLSKKYIKSNSIVLEIGGNMGRNALVISTILTNDNNLVTMEPNKEFYEKLITNRNYNNKNFHVENSCLSKSKTFILNSRSFQEGKVHDIYPQNYKNLKLDNAFETNCIDYDSLCNKYNKIFDTLCIDCEGAFYYILNDFPNILDNIKLIIMENDYENINHYNHIKEFFINKHFILVESIPLKNCPWNAPCKDFFYQVWKLS